VKQVVLIQSMKGEQEGSAMDNLVRLEPSMGW